MSLRAYLLVTFPCLPVVQAVWTLGYLPPVQGVILGFVALLAIKMVVFEPRRASKRFVAGSLAVLGPCAILVGLNFGFGLVQACLRGFPGAAWRNGLILGVTGAFFAISWRFQPFQQLNRAAVRWHAGWTRQRSVNEHAPDLGHRNGRRNGHGHQSPRLRRKVLTVASFAWVGVTFCILLVPYPTHARPAMTGPPGTPDTPRRLGFWTSGVQLDPQHANASTYLSDANLTYCRARGVYFVIGCRFHEPYGDLARRLARCRDHGIEVNVYFCPKTPGDSFANIWTFERLQPEMEAVLQFLHQSGFLGNPVTTLVYDMEGLPDARHFPFYWDDRNITAQLADYYRVQALYRAFNRRVREEYGLGIRVCTDYFQGLDETDGDDDVAFLNGVMDDAPVNWSYMAYRRDNVGQNFLLDHARFLSDGDTVILNAWKFESYFCHGDLACLVEDCRLLLAYPGKTLHLEFWALRNFLPSYGLDGMLQLVAELTDPQRPWPAVTVRNAWWHAPFWDLVAYGTFLLDAYGPVLRVVFRA